MTRTLRRAAAAFALLGVTFSALWPLVSQARIGPPGIPQVICSSGGMQVHPAPGAPSLPDHDTQRHCAMCLGAIEPVVAFVPAFEVERDASSLSLDPGAFDIVESLPLGPWPPPRGPPPVFEN